MRRMAGLLVVLASTWNACAAEKVLPLEGEQFTVAGRAAFLILPEDAESQDTIPWVWYAPTLLPYPGAEERWMLEQFTAAGFAIAGIDVGESYGSPDGVELYAALHHELVESHNLSSKPVLLARSRGGLMLLNWAVKNPGKVSGFAGIYPVCDLRSYPGLATACGAYGLTELELRQQLAIFNPLNQLKWLAEARVPVYLHHGDSDTTVPLEANSGAFAERYRALSGSVTLNVVKGGGHTMWEGWFHHQPLVDFVIQQGRSTASGTQ